MKKKYTSSRAREYTRVSTALIIAFVCVVAVFNTIIYALGEKYEWYFYKAESYEHNISDTSERLFSGEMSDTEIIFCMDEDELTSDVVYNLVWQTAKQLEEKHEFLSVRNVNIYLQPKELSKYKYETDENGEQVKVAHIDKRSVIIASEKGHKVLSLSSFFVLNSSEIITAYNGEEVMLSSIMWVQKEEHPIAYFTNTHGESFASLLGLYDVLTNSGYEVKMLDLFAEEIDERAEIIIMANPIYDIEKASPEANIVSEAEALTAYLERGGALFVGLDPYVKSPLTNLKGLLSSYGMSAENSIINDRENSITHDGYTLVAQYADTESGRAFSENIGKYNGSYTVVKDASPITLEKTEKAEPQAIITSSITAKAYKDGELVSDSGSFPLLAMAKTEKSRIFLSSGAYLLTNDVVNSEIYSNRELLFTILEEAGCDYNPIGAEFMPIGNTMLEGLTVKTSNAYAVVLVLVIPIIIGATAFILLTRRKNR